MKLNVIFVSLLLLSSCAFFRPEAPVLPDETPEKKAQDLQKISAAQKTAQGGQFEESLNLYRDFASTRATSAYWLSAKLGEADSLHQLGRSTEALQVLQQVRDVSLQRKPFAAATASYQMSFIYEDLGDFEKTLASLNEAFAQKKHLQPVVAEAEIPARMALVYAKMGLLDKAIELVQKANSGIERVRANQQNKDTSWLAEVYFKMGKVSSQSQFASNWEVRMETLSLVYPFLFKAIQQNVEPWSANAKQSLLVLYQDAFNILFSDKFDKRENKRNAARFDVELQRAESYRSLTGEAPSGLLSEVYKIEDDMRRRLSLMIYSGESDMKLTPDSEQRGSVLKGYRLVNPPNPRSAAEGQDPNL